MFVIRVKGTDKFLQKGGKLVGLQKATTYLSIGGAKTHLKAWEQLERIMFHLKDWGLKSYDDFEIVEVELKLK